jgi:hypothetical protein
VQRPLQKEELEQANMASHNDWDDGALARCISTLQSSAYDGEGYTICMWNPKPEIAQQAIHLLMWLGAPKGFRVFLFWRDDPRILTATGILTPKNVNGGFAVPNTPQLFIYRSEEWDRVLLHECIHALGWDWPSFPVQPCWKLAPNSTLLPYLFEAWTELFAEWLWCLWWAPEDDTTGYTWSLQREWQEVQALQVLARSSDRWMETTNAFAYYVLKTALAPRIDFLLIMGSEIVPTEVCERAGVELDRLRARPVRPKRMRLRMTNPKIHE